MCCLKTLPALSLTIQDIYGIEAGMPAEEVVEGVDEVEGNDCVICLSLPRDTTVLPCRHMCLCQQCARELRAGNQKCPICRA